MEHMDIKIHINNLIAIKTFFYQINIRVILSALHIFKIILN